MVSDRQTDSQQQETKVNGILCYWVSQIAMRVKKKEKKTKP